MFDVWKNVLAEVEQLIPHEAFATWFDGVSLVGIEDGVVKVGVPNVFKLRQLKQKYDNYVREALKNNRVEFDEIEYVVKSSSKVRPRSMEVAPREVNKFSESFRENKTIREVAKKFTTGLNEKYSMDNFVVGSNNDFAVNVAREIIERPGGRFNPFFLYGGPGLGKTHLVQAIGNELVRKNARVKLLYVTTNDFYAEFIRSIKNRKGDNFAQKFRNLDVLIIDDFQAIIGKDASQREFFNIFNDLHQRNKQIVVTCDRLPEQLKELDPRLTSRLAWTGPVDLQMPDFEEKCAILKAKAEFQGYEVEDEVIEFIAENVKTNIRELEGMLNRVVTYADVKNVTPLEILHGGLITTRTAERRKSLTARQVVEKVAKCSDLSVDEMCGKSRVAHIKTARQIAMYLLSEELGMSTPKIAREVGVKDHTTVMHGIKKIRDDLKLDFKLRDKVEDVREKLYG